MNTLTTDTTTPASARHRMGMERTLYLLMGICWAMALGIALLILAEAVAL